MKLTRVKKTMKHSKSWAFAFERHCQVVVKINNEINKLYFKLADKALEYYGVEKPEEAEEAAFKNVSFHSPIERRMENKPMEEILEEQLKDDPSLSDDDEQFVNIQNLMRLSRPPPPPGQHVDSTQQASASASTTTTTTAEIDNQPVLPQQLRKLYTEKSKKHD